MSSYREAVLRLRDLGRIRKIETVPLSEARGRVLARDVVGREALPPFDNSAMDGFCIRSRETEGADAGRPARLRVGPTQYAGAPVRAEELERVAAIRIMTGGPIPPGFDTVVRLEDARVERDGEAEILVIDARVPPGVHVRKCGEDVNLGDRLLEAGTVLTPGRISVVAGQGIAELAVLAMPRLRLLATGDELLDDPSRPLEPGQIRNTSLHLLLAEAARLNLPAVREGVVPDRIDEVAARVQGWLDERSGMTIDDPRRPAVPDLVISTGAVSMGQKDFVPELLRRLGFDTLVHGVSVRPGKPVLIARHRASAMAWIGLPGNVLSTAASFRFFVLPAIRSLLGLAPEPLRLRAQIAAPFSKPRGVRFFARCTIRLGDGAAASAWLERRQGAGMLSALAGTDAYAVIPEEPSFLPAGSIVEVEPDVVGLE